MAIDAAKLRKRELVEATISEIGRTGSLNVTVGQIAKTAGVSSALAFHYFGDKDRLFVEAMRHILSLYGAEIRGGLRSAHDPRARLDAILAPNFSPANFRKEVVSAWMNFYVLAQQSEAAAQLLRIYHRRLNSNLTDAFRPLIGSHAPMAALRIAALIDGLYLRIIQAPAQFSGAEAIEITRQAIENEIEAYS